MFNDYWRDIERSVLFEASIELPRKIRLWLCRRRPLLRARFSPTRTFQLSWTVLVRSLIEGAHIEESVIGVRSIIRSGSVIRKSVLMGNDFYEQGNGGKKYALGIGQNCRIQNCIIDKNVRIGNNVSITNRKNVQEEDGKNYHIREGIVIIPKAAVIADGTRI
jgi:ADP-glucose pyrophosphorylase